MRESEVEFAIEFKEISKRFGAIQAANRLSFSVRPGSLHAIAGENGAGKSTAMKLLCGFYKPDSGSIYVNSQKRVWRSPEEAMNAGIGMVHQHFMLAESHTVFDNLIIGFEQSAWIPKSQLRSRIDKLMKETGLQVPLDHKVSELSIGNQQRVEILKVLLKGAKIIILDEPTAVLTPQEVQDLFQVLQALKKSGKTLLLITHKLKEILEHTDTVTILRAGESVANFQTSEATLQSLADAMVGRQVKLKSSSTQRKERDDKVLLNLENLTLHTSEIVGIAGVEGNGQAEWIEKILNHFPKREEIGLIPTDRHSEGLLLEQSAAHNFILGQEDKIYHQALEKTLEAMKSFDVRPCDPKLKIKGFSGGNQQKLIIARELSKNPKLLIASQPTRGVDVGAIEYIHAKLLESKTEGKGILLISSELDELFDLSDRILVIFKGQFIGEFKRSLDPDREPYDKLQIGALMGGQKLA